MVDAAVVVTTHNALPWIEQCLESVGGAEAVVVDNDSTDGTVDFVRERFPEVRVLEQANRGLAAGWKRGLEEIPPSRWVLILNADAWLEGDALAQLVAVGDAHRDVAVVAPKLLNPDGTLQRSVRGFPTRWRLATEYFYLRKLGPGTDLLNGVLRRRLRPRLRARGRMRDGRVHARAPHRHRRGRPARPELLPLLRGGRLVLPLRPGGLEDALHARRAVRARRGRLARRAGSTATTCAGTSASSSSITGSTRPSGCGCSCDRALALRGRVVRGEKGAMYRDAARWIESGDVPTLIER